MITHIEDNKHFHTNYIKGPTIINIKEFDLYRGPIWNDNYTNPIRHKSFYENMQYRVLKNYIASGILHQTELAVKIGRF